MKILVIPELDWITALQNRVHKIFQRFRSDDEIHVIYFEHEKRNIKKSVRLRNNIILHKPPTIFIKNLLLYYLLNSPIIYFYINRLIHAYGIQVIVTTNFLFAPFAIRTAKKNSMPLIFDLVDFQSYHINYIRFLPSVFKKIGSSVLTNLLNFDISHATHVITTGLPLFHYVKQKKLQKVTIISNGVDTNLFTPSQSSLAVQKNLKVTAPIISFVGALEYWVDYHVFFHSISLLLKKFPSLHCLLIGPSRHFGINKIKQLAVHYNILKHIIFTGRVPYQELPSYICASDICMLPFVKNYLTHCIVPMKLFEYLACGRPIVATPLAGIKSIAKNTIFYANTPIEMCNKMEYLLTNPEKIQDKIELGKAIVNQYSWLDLASNYRHILEQISTNFPERIKNQKE